MPIVDPNDLAATLEALNDALFFGRAVPKSERAQIAKWIASRQGLPGSYRGMPAPTEGNFREPVRVFTGETVGSRAGTAHILGEEACRALILLGTSQVGVQDALERSTEWLRAWLAEGQEARTGRYCCCRCSVALWRHVAVSELPGAEACLAAGVSTLADRREATGRWQGFPFWYTVFALNQMELAGAEAEIRHAVPALERFLRGRAGAGKVHQRRTALAEKVLGRGASPPGTLSFA